MPIFKGSRYRYSKLVQSEDGYGNIHRTYALRKTGVEAPLGSASYTTRAGDTFETLAFQHYGDGNKWYVIAEANPSIFWPLDLEAGTLIYIPPKTYAAVI